MSPKTTGLKKVNLKQYVTSQAKNRSQYVESVKNSDQFGEIGEMNMLQKVTPRGPQQSQNMVKRAKEASIGQIFDEINENKVFQVNRRQFESSDFNQKFKENQDMKQLIEDLKVKYLNQPVFKLIMLDNKVDLDLKMCLLTSNFDKKSDQNFDTFESFGDQNKLKSKLNTQSKAINQVFSSLAEVLDTVMLKSCLISKLKNELNNVIESSKSIQKVQQFNHKDPTFQTFTSLLKTKVNNPEKKSEMLKNLVEGTSSRPRTPNRKSNQNGQNRRNKVKSMSMSAQKGYHNSYLDKIEDLKLSKKEDRINHFEDLIRKKNQSKPTGSTLLNHSVAKSAKKQRRLSKNSQKNSKQSKTPKKISKSQKRVKTKRSASNPLNMDPNQQYRSPKSQKTKKKQSEQEKSATKSKNGQKRRRHNLSLNIQKLQQDVDQLSTFSLVTPKRAKKTFKESLQNSRNSRMSQKLKSKKKVKSHSISAKLTPESNVFSQIERLQTEDSAIINDSQFSQYFSEQKNHSTINHLSMSNPRYRLKDNYFSDKKPQNQGNSGQKSPYFNPYKKKTAHTLTKIEHSGPMFSTLQPQTVSHIPNLGMLNMKKIAPFNTMKGEKAQQNDTMVLSFSNLNISNYNNINNFMEHGLKNATNLTSSIQTRERDSNLTNLTNLTANSSEKSKNSQFGIQAVLTKKLEETAQILGRIKSKLSLKANDQIVDKIEVVQKKLAKSEKFISALGKLAKELESSIELGSIFKSENGEDISYKDPKLLWKWIKNFFVRFMELKKGQISLQRQVQSLEFDENELKGLNSELEQKLEDLVKLEGTVKEFFGLDDSLGTSGVLRAVERMCNVAGIKKQ